MVHHFDILEHVFLTAPRAMAIMEEDWKYVLVNELFAEIYFTNSVQFAENISGGFIFSFSLGYNINKGMTIICDFTFGYWEYALPDNEKLFQDYKGIKFGISIKY